MYPGPVQIFTTGTTTLTVPDFCTGGGRRAQGTDGTNFLTVLGYPYFPINPVDCCVYCAQQFVGVIAAAQILDCECLLSVGEDNPGKSDYCPNGLVPFALSKKNKPGSSFPGPCHAGAK